MTLDVLVYFSVKIAHNPAQLVDMRISSTRITAIPFTHNKKHNCCIVTNTTLIPMHSIGTEKNCSKRTSARKIMHGDYSPNIVPNTL